MDLPFMSNDTQNFSQNTSSDAIFAGEHALLHALEHSYETGLLADVMVLVAFLALLASQCLWRPRLTGAVVVSWLAWFAVRLCQGQVAWTQVIDHAQNARKATEAAVTASVEMLKSWCVLLAPALLDLQHLAAPAMIGLGQAWDQMSWHERGMVALLGLVAGSSVITVSALFRHKETVAEVLFQLSFIVCGPVVWWLTSHMPHKYSAVLVSVVMSLLPNVASLWLFLRSQWEKDTPRTKAEPARDAWFAGFDSPEMPISDKLQSKLGLWLSYWSCWPFFHITYTFVNAAGFVAKEDKASVDGLFVAVILWSQFWRASRIAPYAFAVSATLFRSCTEKTQKVTEEASNQAMGKAVQCYMAVSERVSNSWVIYLGAGVVVLIVVAFFLRVVELAEAFVTLVFFFGVAFDTARCVARNVVDVYTSRVAFWLIAICWLKIREMPFLGNMLVVWTPLVLVAALAAGETLLNSIIYLVESCFSRCKRSSQSSTAEREALTEPSKYEEVPEREEA